MKNLMLFFAPVSATYISDLLPLFEKTYGVLKVNGLFLFRTPNPLIYLFNNAKWEQGILEVSNKLPFNSLDELSEEETEVFIRKKTPIEYSHTLEVLLGQKTNVGYAIVGFYEDRDSEKISQYIYSYLFCNESD